MEGMSVQIAQEAQRAIAAGRYLQDCYRKMQPQATDKRTQAVIHDLLLMEELNEVLLRSLSGNS